MNIKNVGLIVREFWVKVDFKMNLKWKIGFLKGLCMECSIIKVCMFFFIYEVGNIIV